MYLFRGSKEEVDEMCKRLNAQDGGAEDKVPGERIVGRWDEIQVGDHVAEDALSGPCSGGARYGITHRVNEVTETETVTKHGRWCRKTGKSIPESAYELFWWKRGGEKGE